MNTDKKGEKSNKVRRTVSASFITGAIALVFLIVGFQAALFLSKVRQKSLAAKEMTAMEADSAYVASAQGETAADTYNNNGLSESDNGSAGNSDNGPGNRTNGNQSRGNSGGASTARNNNSTQKPASKRTVENFRFNPNTATVEELQRLGFSEKQAQSIENYRLKGGKFRRKSDFAKSFVVADSVYRRLEPYIDIPLLDLNIADSAAFTTLPGIGGYFAAKMVEYRKQLGGYSYKEQLMDIYRFDSDKFAGLEDLIYIESSNTRPYPLWTLPEDSLALHPYIGSYAAHGIVVFREHNPVEDWTVENLDKAGILREGMGAKLTLCFIADIF